MKKPFIPFTIAGFLIGLLLTLQFRSELTSVSSYPLDEYEFQVALVQSFLDDQAALEERLNELNIQVDEAEERVSNLYQFVDTDYLEELKVILGLTEVKGSGLEIILNDSEQASRETLGVDANGLVHASDLRDIINLLRTFPLEGIAINDQRVVASTPITSAGSSILVNNFNVVPPFKIDVITELPDLVIQKLSTEEELPGIYSRIAGNGLKLKFRINKKIILPPYLSGYSTDFIKPLKDE